MGQTYEIAWSNGFTNTGIELFKGNTEVLDISGDKMQVHFHGLFQPILPWERLQSKNL